MILQQPPSLPLDPNLVANQLIPLIGMVAALIVGGVVLYAFFKSDLAAALAERIRAKTHRHKGITDPGHVEELEERVSQMQGQIAEMAERLDFAERLLAQKRERSLPGA